MSLEEQIITWKLNVKANPMLSPIPDFIRGWSNIFGRSTEGKITEEESKFLQEHLTEQEYKEIEEVINSNFYSNRRKTNYFKNSTRVNAETILVLGNSTIIEENFQYKGFQGTKDELKQILSKKEFQLLIGISSPSLLSNLSTLSNAFDSHQLKVNLAQFTYTLSELRNSYLKSFSSKQREEIQKYADCPLALPVVEKQTDEGFQLEFSVANNKTYSTTVPHQYIFF